MCLQCETSCVLLIPEIIPGYSVYQSHAATEHWPLGDYALIESNDPEFTWSGVPPMEAEPHSDEDTPDVAKAKTRQTMRLSTYTRNTKILLDPMRGYRFVEACKQAGYDPEVDGEFVIMWFFDRVARRLQGGA